MNGLFPLLYWKIFPPGQHFQNGKALCKAQAAGLNVCACTCTRPAVHTGLNLTLQIQGVYREAGPCGARVGGPGHQPLLLMWGSPGPCREHQCPRPDTWAAPGPDSGFRVGWAHRRVRPTRQVSPRHSFTVVLKT